MYLNLYTSLVQAAANGSEQSSSNVRDSQVHRSVQQPSATPVVVAAASSSSLKKEYFQTVHAGGGRRPVLAPTRDLSGPQQEIRPSGSCVLKSSCYVDNDGQIRPTPSAPARASASAVLPGSLSEIEQRKRRDEEESRREKEEARRAAEYRRSVDEAGETTQTGTFSFWT